MAAPDLVRSFEELTIGKGASLEELVDRGALGELAKSCFVLFGIPLRIYAEGGALLAEASELAPMYDYLNGLPKARALLQDEVNQVKGVNPALDGEVKFSSLTGAIYLVASLNYDCRQVGRLILGPFVPPRVRELPPALLALDPEIDPVKARALLVEMPRAREETVSQIAQHLCRSLDLILFSGHKALLTGQLHLASVREGFHNLQEKNEKLQEAYERLKELDRLKSNFLATVSHELRTPLTSIIGYSEMLAEGIVGELGGEQREFVQTIREKGEQLLSLIKGLLDLSKLESGTMSLRRAYVDVAVMLQDVNQTMTPQARKKGVELAVQVAKGLPMLWADGDRLRQVLLNLVENAVKFTPKDGRVVLSATLSSMSMAPGDDDGTGRALFGNRRMSAELRVMDTGVGIPPGQRDCVFDAFYQIDSSSTREQGGTGLGLSIVKRLVLAHDGTIRIEDNRPQGTVFIVNIPYRRTSMV